MKNLVSSLFSLLILFYCSTSLGNPSDLFDLDPRGKGTASSSSTVNPSFWTAAVHNPAALTGTDKISVGYNYSYGYMNLDINGSPANVLDYRGADMGIAIPLGKIFGIKMAVGTTVHLPDQMIIRAQAIPASEPRFIMYDNYPHRMQMGIGVGIEPFKWLKLGLGASVMMDLQGDSIHLNVGSQGGNKISEMEMDTALPYKLTPYGGLIIDGAGLSPSLHGFKLALFYREPYYFKLKMNILADVDVAGIVKGDAIIALKMFDHFSPRKISMGLMWKKKDKIALFAGIDWLQWSQFNAGISSLKILVDLGVNPPLIEATFPPDNFHNTISPKFGMELFAGKVSFRGGYSYIPSPTPKQTGLSTLMDNDRHLLAMGLSYGFTGPSFLPWPAVLNFSYQIHGLVNRTDTKGNPTLPPVSYGGTIHQISIGMEMEF
jgi:Outer membrane protein transport protein (OMPP1/FadL/TodX)